MGIEEEDTEGTVKQRDGLTRGYGVGLAFRGGAHGTVILIHHDTHVGLKVLHLPGEIHVFMPYF